MSIRTRPSAEVSEDTRSELEQALITYYSCSPDSYYLGADSAAESYDKLRQPFHCDLVKRIRQGDRVLEVGCGTAHLCPFIENAGGQYTGLDHGARLLERNQQRFPNSRFFPLTTPLEETFDVVASLYTIEHVTQPVRYLEILWGFCRPGGLVAIICPDFIDGAGLPPSFYYGRTPRRIREKIASLDFSDAACHLLDLLWFAPRWKTRAHKSPAGTFWINLAPRLLAGAAYSVDADAVHLPRLTDLIWWFGERGAEIVATSQSVADVDERVLRHNCYVLARKSDSSAE